MAIFQTFASLLALASPEVDVKAIIITFGKYMIISDITVENN